MTSLDYLVSCNCSCTNLLSKLWPDADDWPKILLVTSGLTQVHWRQQALSATFVQRASTNSRQPRLSGSVPRNIAIDWEVYIYASGMGCRFLLAKMAQFVIMDEGPLLHNIIDRHDPNEQYLPSNTRLMGMFRVYNNSGRQLC